MVTWVPSVAGLGLSLLAVLGLQLLVARKKEMWGRRELAPSLHMDTHGYTQEHTVP